MEGPHLTPLSPQPVPLRSQHALQPPLRTGILCWAGPSRLRASLGISAFTHGAGAPMTLSHTPLPSLAVHGLPAPCPGPDA